MEREEIIRHKAKRLTVVLRNGRQYSGGVLSVSQPNHINKCLVTFHDNKSGKTIVFVSDELSSIEYDGGEHGGS